MLPPAGQIFEKRHLLCLIDDLLRFFLRLSSSDLAGVLPSAGQIFEKRHLLANSDNFLYFFMAFKQGG